MSQEGFTIEPIKEPGFISIFRLYRKTSPERSLSVAQPVDEDRILISSRITLGEEVRLGLAKLPASARTKIERDLISLLHSRPTLFRMDDADGTLKGVSIFEPIYADGLTKDRVMSAISQIFKTEALLLIRLGERFEEISPQPASASTTAPARLAITSNCSRCGTPIIVGGKFCGKCGNRLV